MAPLNRNMAAKVYMPKNFFAFARGQLKVAENRLKMSKSKRQNILIIHIFPSIW